ncbi:unnamed protein product, partial [Brenthis ino]
MKNTKTKCVVLVSIVIAVAATSNHCNSICADVAVPRPKRSRRRAVARCFVYTTPNLVSPLHRGSIKDKSIRQSIASEFNRVSEPSGAPSLPPQLAHAALPSPTHPARKTNKKSCPQNGRRPPPAARRPPRRFVIASPQLL